MPKSASLANLSVEDLHREIRSRQRHRPALERKRNKLLKKLEAVEAEIAALGGSSGSARPTGRRKRHEGGLIAFLRKALAGKTLSVGEAIDAVKKLGYTSTSPNFRVIVNATLGRKGAGFKRVGRGQYTAA